MKSIAIAITSAAALSVVLGACTYGYSAQEHSGEKQENSRPQQAPQGQGHPAQQREQPQQQQRPQQQQQQHAQPQQQHVQQQQRAQQPQQQQQHSQRPQQQVQHAQQVSGNNDRYHRSPEQQHFQQNAWQQHSANNWQADHRGWRDRGGYSGYRISDDHFRGFFGEGHGFRIGGLPFLVVGGYPRFQYGGYWFSMVDPYPGSWANNWYDTDDVYVDYADGGYYLHNRRYPGIGIAVSVSM
jgi:hypothetical protein